MVYEQYAQSMNFEIKNIKLWNDILKYCVEFENFHNVY